MLVPATATEDAERTKKTQRVESLLTVEQVLMDGFKHECQHVFGKNYNNLGTKWKALLQNISDVKRLMWTL